MRTLRYLSLVLLVSVFPFPVHGAESGAPPVDFSHADWQLDYDGQGIHVYRWTPPHSDLFAFRAEGEIPTTVPKLVQVLCDVTRRTEWAPTISETYIVRWLSPVERVEYERIRTPIIIRDREFVIQGKAEFDGKGGVALRFHSIDDHSMPDRGLVRGEAYDSTYILTPTANRKATKLEYRMLIDPKGSVPKWIVNIFQEKFPQNMIAALRRQVAKPGITDYPMPPGSGWENTTNTAVPSTTTSGKQSASVR